MKGYSIFSQVFETKIREQLLFKVEDVIGKCGVPARKLSAQCRRGGFSYKLACSSEDKW